MIYGFTYKSDNFEWVDYIYRLNIEVLFFLKLSSLRILNGTNMKGSLQTIKFPLK